MLAAECRWSPSSNSQPSSRASREPIVDLPLPATPATTTIIEPEPPSLVGQPPGRHIRRSNGTHTRRRSSPGSGGGNPAGAYRGGMTSPDRPSGPTAPPGGGGTSVLVVEDDPGIATQLVRGLSRSGYTVDHVTTGQEALGRADPDVVLLDLGLPDGDGGDRCRQLSQRSGLAIMLVTAPAGGPGRV